MRLIIITGASKGFGRCIAQSFVRYWKEHAASTNIHIALFGRDRRGLEETRSALGVSGGSIGADGSAWTASTSVHCVDFGQREPTLPTAVEHALPQLPPADSIEDVTLVNNAGSLGELKRIVDLEYGPLMDALHCNVTACIHFTTAVLRHYAHVPQRTIIHISSLCAIAPFDAMTVYCTGKAARDMFHRCLALEHSNNNNTYVINYAPGPMDTAMQQSLREELPVDCSLREVFRSMHEGRQLVEPERSAEALVRLVMDRRWRKEYPSGAHVDYLDDLMKNREFVAASSSTSSDDSDNV